MAFILNAAPSEKLDQNFEDAMGTNYRFSTEPYQVVFHVKVKLTQKKQN